MGTKRARMIVLPAVLLEEAVRAVQVLLLQEADLAAKGPRPNIARRSSN